MMKLMRFVRNLIFRRVFALGTLLFLCGCQSAELSTLENAASILELQTGREVDRWQQDKGVVLTKPVDAELEIRFEPIESFTREEVYAEIVTIFENNQWERDKNNFVPEAFIAFSQQGDFRIRTMVLINAEENLVTVYLEEY